MTKFDLTHKSNLLFIMARKVPTNDSFFKVLAYVLKETRDNGEFTHTHTFTAKGCGVSVNTVNRVMKKAVEYGLFNRLDISDGYGKRYIYETTKNPEWIDVMALHKPELVQTSTGTNQNIVKGKPELIDNQTSTDVDIEQNIVTTKTSKDLSKTSNKPYDTKKSNLRKKDQEKINKSRETLKRVKAKKQVSNDTNNRSS